MRTDVKQQGHMKSLTEIQEDEGTPLNNSNTKIKIKKNKDEMNGSKGRQDFHFEVAGRVMASEGRIDPQNDFDGRNRKEKEVEQ